MFLLVGGPAAGKSTTASALAGRFAKSVHIPVDAVRDMVVSGQALPGADWSQELIEQLMVARDCATYLALAYHQVGFAVIIDDFWDPNSGLAEYADLFNHPQVRKVLLYPSKEAARARSLQRSGPGGAHDYIDQGIQLVYQQLETVVADLEAQGWWVLDTTELGVEEVVASILERTGIG